MHSTLAHEAGTNDQGGETTEDLAWIGSSIIAGLIDRALQICVLK